MNGTKPVGTAAGTKASAEGCRASQGPGATEEAGPASPASPASSVRAKDGPGGQGHERAAPEPYGTNQMGGKTWNTMK